MSNDKSLWINFYNLPKEGRDKYLSWLHGTYIPKMLKKPGILSAAHYQTVKYKIAPHIQHTKDKSVPDGNDFVLIFVGESSATFSKGPDAFLKGTPARLDIDLTDVDKKMLARRSAERILITTEETRADGTAASKRESPTMLSPCVQIGSFNTDSFAAEDEFLSWCMDWRVGAVAELAGCVGVRKMLASLGWAKHVIMYEFVSMEAKEGLAQVWKTYPEMWEWSEKAIPHLTHSPESPVLCDRIWPPKPI